MYIYTYLSPLPLSSNHIHQQLTPKNQFKTSSSNLPTVGTRTIIGNEDFHSERAPHQNLRLPLPTYKPPCPHLLRRIHNHGPHGAIPIRIFYPTSDESHRKSGDAGALIYFHGGGCTVGIIDEFEKGLRIVAEESRCQIYGVENRLAPEWRFPTQLDECITVIQ